MNDRAVEMPDVRRRGSAERYLELRQLPRKPGMLSGLRSRLRTIYRRLVGSAYKLARIVHTLIMAAFTSRRSEKFSQCRLTNLTRWRAAPLDLGFSHRAWRSSVAPWRAGYNFVPPDALDLHSDSKRNTVYLHKLSAHIALFPASHPLLLFPENRKFLFEKLHEIPYHGPDAILYLSEFKWTSIIRPTYKLNIDISGTCVVYDFKAPAIYVGGSLNFGHFLTDYYPKFLAIDAEARKNSELRSALPRVVIVYCEQVEFDYLERSHPEYEFVNLKGYQSVLIAGSELYTTPLIPFPVGCHLLRQQFLGDQRLKEGARGPATMIMGVPRAKVFLSRRGFARRRIENEDELIAMLEELGFDIINVKDHSIEELASKLANYDMVASGFGAHTVNAIFLPPGSLFFEIVPRSFDTSHGWQYNHALFMSAGLRYVRAVADDSTTSIKGGEDATGIFDWEGRVDVDVIKQHLISVGAGE